MADWTTIPLAKGQTSDSDDYHSYLYKGLGEASNNVKIRVQYDKDSMTPTSVKIRFIAIDELVGTSSWTDGFYILYNANNSPKSIGRINRRVKSPDGKWLDDDLTPITITKNYDSDEVTVQDFWICNIGQGSYSDGKVTYTSGTKTVYEWFKDGGAREGYKTKVSSFTLSGLTKATDCTVSKPTITDHKNGKFSISATAGKAGKHNAVKSSTLKYKIGGGDWITAKKLSVSDESLTCGAGTDSQTIKAKTEVEGTYNSPTASADSVTVKNYQAPGLPGTVSLTKTKDRLTVKENWTISWGAAFKTNDSSPVAGYRIRMYVKKAGEDSFVTTPIKNSSGNNRTGVNKLSSTDYYCDLGKSTTSITIYPDKQPASYSSGERTLKGGDVIKFLVQARSVNGNSESLWSGERWSQEWTIQNAGVMRVKVNTGTAAKPSYSWKEGVVWVKVNKGTAAKPNIQWVEADLVKTKVKTNDTAANPIYGWKDSG